MTDLNKTLKERLILVYMLHLKTIIKTKQKATKTLLLQEIGTLIDIEDFYCCRCGDAGFNCSRL